jgi:hypothetical protein
MLLFFQFDSYFFDFYFSSFIGFQFHHLSKVYIVLFVFNLVIIFFIYFQFNPLI